MNKQKLILEQTNNKILHLKMVDIPGAGWVNSIRLALGMSLRQLGEKMGITAQSVREIELREKNETISIKVLKQFGNAIGLKFVYGFVPYKGDLIEIIEKRANELAREIVNRTSVTMKLEDQENNPSRIQKAISEKTEELKIQMPKYLWDQI